jgi:hypothetical protein
MRLDIRHRCYVFLGGQVNTIRRPLNPHSLEYVGGHSSSGPRHLSKEPHTLVNSAEFCTHTCCRGIVAGRDQEKRGSGGEYDVGHGGRRVTEVLAVFEETKKLPTGML